MRGFGDYIDSTTHARVAGDPPPGSLADIQQKILQAKLASLQVAPSNFRVNLTNHQPADANTFQVNSNPFPAYPAPGAAAVTILSYQVPQGLTAVINLLAIVAVGGGFIDGSGNVVWRCWVNGMAIEGLDTITAHIGSFDMLQSTQILLHENDLFYITVEVPAGQNPMPGGASSGARVQGWAYPVGKTVGP